MLVGYWHIHAVLAPVLAANVNVARCRGSLMGALLDANYSPNLTSKSATLFKLRASRQTAIALSSRVLSINVQRQE